MCLPEIEGLFCVDGVLSPEVLLQLLLRDSQLPHLALSAFQDDLPQLVLPFKENVLDPGEVNAIGLPFHILVLEVLVAVESHLVLALVEVLELVVPLFCEVLFAELAGGVPEIAEDAEPV